MKDIMLIMSDQHGGAYTGMEDDRVRTPALMRIAGEGLYFERCYCNAPLCVPSRMSFLSGKLPSDLNIFNNDTVLPADVPTIAHALGAAGYHTVGYHLPVLGNRRKRTGGFRRLYRDDEPETLSGGCWRRNFAGYGL